jgi:hypothetical protein
MDTSNNPRLCETKRSILHTQKLIKNNSINLFSTIIYIVKNITMPFSNTYNRSVANKVIANAKKDIACKDKMYDDPASFVEPRSQQEYQTVQHPDVVGGYW